MFTYQREDHPNVGRINHINQTDDGVIWFAGSRGILRYDGARFIRQDGEDGLQSDFVYRLKHGPDRSLYACTWRGLHRYDEQQQRWELMPYRSDEPVRDLAFTPYGKVLATDNAAMLIRGRASYRLPIRHPDSPSPWIGPAHEVAYDSSTGLLWVGTDYHGLVSLRMDSVVELFEMVDPKRQEILEAYGPEVFQEQFGADYRDPNHYLIGDSLLTSAMRRGVLQHVAMDGGRLSVQDLVVPSDGEVLFSTVNGIYRVDGGAAVSDRSLSRLSQGVPYLLDHQHDKIHMAIPDNAWQITPRDTVHYPFHHNMEGGRISAMFSDRDGIVWYGHEEGWIRKQVHPAITGWVLPNRHAIGAVVEAVEDGDGHLLLIGRHGVARVGENSWEMLHVAEGLGAEVRAAIRDQQGNLLIAESHRVIVRDARSGRRRVVLQSHLALDDTQPFYATRNGVWYRLERVLYRWDGRDLNREPFNAELPLITTILDGPGISTLFGSWVGLLQKTPSTFHRFSKLGVLEAQADGGFDWITKFDNEIFPDESVLAAAAGPDSAIWCGTLSGGILRFEDGKLHHARSIDGERLLGTFGKVKRTVSGELYFHGAMDLARVNGEGLELLDSVNVLDAVIHQIGEDHRGRLYLSTPRGVIVLNDGRQQVVIGPNLGIRFGSLVGVYPIGDSRITMVQDDRLIIIDIDNYLNRDATLHRPVVHRITAGELSRRPDGAVQLNQGDRSLQLTFSLPFYQSEESHEFSWRLAGLDEQFRPFTNHTETSYDRLPPGEYTFELKARDSLGRITPAAVPFTVIIPPFFYETGWFKLVLIAVGIGLVVLVVMLSMRQVRRRNQQLERRIQERTRELSDALGELERKREVEVETERLRAVQSLAVTVSHEFNNPLAILKSISQLLSLYRADQLPGQVGDLIRRIPPTVDRLGMLARQLHQINHVRETDYSHGVTMLDLGENGDSGEPQLENAPAAGQPSSAPEPLAPSEPRNVQPGGTR